MFICVACPAGRRAVVGTICGRCGAHRRMSSAATVPSCPPRSRQQPFVRPAGHARLLESMPSAIGVEGEAGVPRGSASDACWAVHGRVHCPVCVGGRAARGSCLRVWTSVSLPGCTGFGIQALHLQGVEGKRGGWWWVGNQPVAISAQAPASIKHQTNSVLAEHQVWC